MANFNLTLVVMLVVILVTINCFTNAAKNDTNEDGLVKRDLNRNSRNPENHLLPKFKKNRLDKLKYYGNIGKRAFLFDIDSNEMEKRQVIKNKKFDKMKFYGIVGKRQLQDFEDENDNGLDSNEQLVDTLVEKKFDKLKYLGRIGKKSQSDEEFLLNNLI